MTTSRKTTALRAFIIVGGLSVSACATTTSGGGQRDTDKFLQTALDTYGVIDVVPSSPIPAAAGQPQGEPLNAVHNSAQRRITVEEACRGRTGIQRRMRDTRTGQPLDCGPADDATT